MNLESQHSQEFNIEPIKITPENRAGVIAGMKSEFFERLGQMRLVDLLFMFERMGGDAKDIEGLSKDKLKEIKAEGNGIFTNPKLSLIKKDRARAAAKEEIQKRLKGLATEGNIYEA